VREKSHIDDMRSAIRGDFERLAKRRGGQELMREPVEDEPDVPVHEDLAESTNVVPIEHDPVSEDAVPVEADVAAGTAPSDEHLEAAGPTEPASDEPPGDEDVREEEPEPAKRSWLARLFGR
jgi:hypothetical protein